MRERRFPADFIWGAATASYQIEGAVERRRPGREHLGPLLAHARAHRRRRHRRRRLRPLPPLSRGRRPHGRARPRRLPLLDRLAARRPRRQRAGQRGRASTSTTGSSTSCSSAASSPSRRSTTGTCRRRSRTPAAGRRDRPPRPSPSTPRVVAAPARRPGPAHRHAQRAIVRRPSSATAPVSTRRAGPSPQAALAAAHHLLLAHGLAVQAIRAARAGDVASVIALNFEAQAPATSHPLDVEAADGGPRPVQPLVPRPRRRPRLPAEGAVRAAAGTVPRSLDGDMERHRRADRLPGRQLLHPRGRPLATPRRRSTDAPDAAS